MTLAEALERYADDAGPKRAAIVRRFVESQGWHPDGSRAIARHLEALTAQGLAPGTVDLAYRTIRAFYRRLGLAAPKVRGHRYDPMDARRFALSPAVVARLVEVARDGVLLPAHAGYVALSTTYGMRAIEMARVRPEDIDAAGERIRIRTAKHGTARWTWMPPEIAAVVAQAGLAPTAVARVESAFAHVWDAAMDEPRPQGVAWHAVRRALNRDLAAAGVSTEDRRRFGRWAGAPSMAERYATPNLTVGETGVAPARLEAEGTRDFDRAVWEAHPYVGFFTAPTGRAGH